jgi:FtsZ-binding cell division protein ZapB
MLQGYGDIVLRAEALEEQLVKARKHSAMLQSKLDGTFAQYHNEVQDMQAKSDELVRKNKSLRNKNKGTRFLVDYLLGVPCSSLTHLAC